MGVGVGVGGLGVGGLGVGFLLRLRICLKQINIHTLSDVYYKMY